MDVWAERATRAATWLERNQDKAGSPEYVEAANAYRAARAKMRETEVPQPTPVSDVPQIPSEPAPPRAGAGANLAAGAISGVSAIPDLLVNRPLQSLNQLGVWPDRLTPQDMGTTLANAAGLENADRQSFPYKVGEITGGGVAGGLPGVARTVTAAGAVPALRSLSRLLAGETVAGVGGAVGGALAGDSVPGQLVGEVVGSMTPAAIAKAGQGAAKFLLMRPGGESQDIIDAADRMDIPLSVGLPGTRATGYLENSLGLTPGPSAFVNKRQMEQEDAFRAALRNSAEDVRTRNLGAPGEPREILNRDGIAIAPSPTAYDAAVPQTRGPHTNEIGAQVREMAALGTNRLRDETRRQEQSMMSRVGADTPVDTRRLERRLGTMIAQSTPGKARAELQSLQTELRQMLREEPGYVQLADQHARLARTMQNTTDPARQAATQQQMDSLQQQMNNWHEAAFAKMEEFKKRNISGRVKDTSSPINNRDALHMYEPAWRSQWETAESVSPGLGSEYRAMKDMERRNMQREGSLLEGGDTRELERVLSKQTDKELAGYVFQGDTVPYERMELLARSVGGPDTPRFRQFLGDLFDNMGLPTPGSVAGGVTDAERFSIDHFMTNWNRLNKDARTANMIRSIDPELSQRIDDIERVGQAIKRRGKASNPSGTTAVALPQALIAGLLGGAGYGSAGLTGLATVAGGYAAFTTAALSEAFTRAAARNPEWAETFGRLAERLTGRAAASAEGLTEVEAQP